MTECKFKPDGQSVSAAALAEQIASYAKVRLCHNLNGLNDYRDWLVHERDRFLICKALRFYAAVGEEAKK